METYYGEIEQAHARIARDRVLGDLRTLVRDSEDLLKATVHSANDTAQTARSRVSLAVERAKDTIAGLQNRGVAAARSASEGCDAAIRKHPLAVAGIAFGLGFAISVLAVGASGRQEDLSHPQDPR